MTTDVKNYMYDIELWDKSSRRMSIFCKISKQFSIPSKLYINASL